MSDQMKTLNATIAAMRTDILSRDESINKLKLENASLISETNALKKALDDIEQYQRRDNLVISGLPGSFADATGATDDGLHESFDSCIKKVIAFCKDKLGCDISSGDISTAHKLPSTGSQRPMIVRFSTRHVRDRVYQSRTKLKDQNRNSPANSRIYINEDLAPLTRKLFAAARRKQGSHGIESVWTMNCHVHIRRNGRINKLATITQLDSLCT